MSVFWELILCCSGSLAGGVDEEMFIKSFEDVPRIQFYSAKELEENLTNIKMIIQDPNNDWSKRAEAVSAPDISWHIIINSFKSFSIIMTYHSCIIHELIDFNHSIHSSPF